MWETEFHLLPRFLGMPVSKMASKSGSTKTVVKRRGQTKCNEKKLTWTDQDTSFFDEVLFDLQDITGFLSV